VVRWARFGAARTVRSADSPDADSPGGHDEPRLRRDAVDGSTDAMCRLATLLLRRRRLTEGTLWFRRALEAGEAGAWRRCADLLAEAEAPGHLRAWCEEFAAAGRADAMLALADLHAAAGDAEAEVTWLARCVDAGRTDRALRLGQLLEAAGRVDEALRAYVTAADGGDRAADLQAGRLLRERDAGAAEHHLRRAADAGDLAAGHELALLLADAGRDREAVALLRRAADLGFERAALALGRLLASGGEAAEAETFLRIAAEAGVPGAGEELVDVLEARLAAADEAGDADAVRRERAALDAVGGERAWLALGHRAVRRQRLDEAVDVLRKAADAGSVAAMTAIADLHADGDRLNEAYDWYLRAAQLGDPGAMVRVGELLFDWSLHDKAVVWLEQARTAGHPAAARVLASRIDEAARRAERLGDTETAQRFVTRLGALETVPAYRVLAARAYAEHDDDRYERWLRKAADAGDAESMADLGKFRWLSRGDGDGARTWCRRAVAAGHWQALYVLDHLLGDDALAEQERRDLWAVAAEAGWVPGIEWMVTRGAVTPAEREHWAGLAAAAGSSLAYVTLGQLALERHDPDAARDWFARGAADDDREAMYRLGLLLLETGDTATALTWLQDAAALEHKEAADRLVALLESRTPPDREPADLWRALFAAMSDEEEAFVARRLGALYSRRGEDRLARRLAELAAGLG
jgi:TPR repeat protein